jgi:hypothetical protein
LNWICCYSNYQAFFQVIRVVYFLLLLVFVSCGPDYDTKYYKATSLDQQDIALLKLQISDANFYGDYQINYGDQSKDEGTISGHVKGDTLIGKYKYLSRGNVESIDPIAFLNDGEKLKLGTGISGTYLGLRVYKFGTITFNDSLFQFQPITAEELTQLKK